MSSTLTAPEVPAPCSVAVSVSDVVSSAGCGGEREHDGQREADDQPSADATTLSRCASAPLRGRSPLLRRRGRRGHRPVGAIAKIAHRHPPCVVVRSREAISMPGGAVRSVLRECPMIDIRISNP
jgi:hypothetical protein